MELTSAQKRHLRGLGHALNPLVFIGQKGVSDNLMENVEQGLLDHELIKLKAHDADELPQALERILNATGATMVQKIGKTVLLYRPHPKDPQITLPK